MTSMSSVLSKHFKTIASIIFKGYGLKFIYKLVTLLVINYNLYYSNWVQYFVYFFILCISNPTFKCFFFLMTLLKHIIGSLQFTISFSYG